MPTLLLEHNFSLQSYSEKIENNVLYLRYISTIYVDNDVTYFLSLSPDFIISMLVAFVLNELQVTKIKTLRTLFCSFANFKLFLYGDSDIKSLFLLCRVFKVSGIFC